MALGSIRKCSWLQDFQCFNRLLISLIFSILCVLLPFFTRRWQDWHVYFSISVKRKKIRRNWKPPWILKILLGGVFRNDVRKILELSAHLQIRDDLQHRTHPSILYTYSYGSTFMRTSHEFHQFHPLIIWILVCVCKLVDFFVREVPGGPVPEPESLRTQARSLAQENPLPRKSRHLYVLQQYLVQYGNNSGRTEVCHTYSFLRIT